MTLYGIKNCDTVKKATDWLKKHRLDFTFHDYKTQGISESKLKAWSSQVGWEVLLNKKGTTWRKLDEKTQSSVTDEQTAVAVMAAHTSLIKRPVIEKDNKVVAVGFDEKVYQDRMK